MATTLPRPSRPAVGPPTTALPPIPTKKRSTAGVIPTAANLQALAAAGTPRSGLRAPSAHITPSRTPTTSRTSVTPKTPAHASSNTLPKLSTTPGVNGAGRSLRKTISINAFPQPPTGGAPIRQSSLPPTPLSAGSASAGQSLQDSSDSSPPRTKVKTAKKTSKSSNATLNQAFSGVSTPSLLNGSGDSRSISSGPGARGSEGLLSLPSPPQSRSSSAQESYSTSATTFDDSGDGVRGRDSHDTAKHMSEGKEGKGNVLVSVRVRPDAKSDHGKGAGNEWSVDCRKSLVAYRGKEGGDYYYDNVFATNDNNDKVYDLCAKRLVRRVMDGYHGTVFAYGMTGTGKTFSMQGTDKQPGVIPRAITDIFAYVRETPDREFLLRVSYLEIYNEKIFDLLAGPNQSEDIKLREDSKGRVYAVPLKEEIVQTPTSLLRVISVGDKNRKTSSTQFNSRSSRSHAVVQIVVESRLRNTGSGTESKRSGLIPGGVRVSTLSLIDLAGSERAADSKERRTEGSHINKSLLTLGTVIARLSGDKDKDGKPTDKDGKHLPYRDSKLTRLLQGALSGEALVSILCTVQMGPAGSAAGSTHVNETLNTLKFASRAKNNIVSHAKKHEEPSHAEDGTLLERYRREIADLKTKLEEANSKKTFDVEDEIEREKEAEIRHEEQLLEMQLARTALKERIDHLQRLVISSKSAGVNSSMSYSSLGMHPRLGSMVSNSHMSQMSARSSLAPSTIGPDRTSLVRSSSINSHSTLGQLPRGQRLSSEQTSMEEEDTMGDSDGNASLVAQNQALQADLAEKNRYISKLEQRLLQARRTSHSRASIGFAGSKIMTGEDHAVSGVLKEKDAEIADLRSRLDDKDRMLTALRSAARSREVADKHNNVELPLSPAASEAYRRSNQSIRSTLSTTEESGNKSPTLGDDRMKSLLSPKTRQRTKSVDEMSKILDEMIQDRVESGQIMKSARGSVRVASERKSAGATAPGYLSPMLEKPELPEMVGQDDPSNVI